MDERQRRVGLNEALFREVNERIREIGDALQHDPASRVDFICECGDPGCTEPIELTLAEYDAARSDPIQFVVRAGHQAHDVEAVVGGTDRYVVIRKREGEPAELAEQLGPRP